MKNKVGPRIDLYGTPESTTEKSIVPLSYSMVGWRLLRYDLNHCIAEELNLYRESFSVKIEWSSRSNALRKLRNRAPIISPLSIHPA